MFESSTLPAYDLGSVTTGEIIQPREVVGVACLTVDLCVNPRGV